MTPTPERPRPAWHRPAALMFAMAAALTGGCAALTNPVADAIPVRRLPAEVLGRPKSELQQLPLTLLRQKEPDVYRLDVGDVLAVVAPVIFPEQQALPVKLADQFSNTSAVGFPTPVRDDGTISLPQIEPVSVRGMTLPQVETLVKNLITGADERGRRLVNPEAAKVSVQLLQPRRYQVLVVREDTQPAPITSGTGIVGQNRRQNGYTVSLEAYKNDVLRALNATGGPPGLDARDEVLIQRGQYDPTDPTKGVVRIPLRLFPDQPLALSEADIILGEGDIIFIQARETDLYYTAGLIGAGQFQLPRDYDLDIIEAIAQVRGPLINGGFSQNLFVAQAVTTGVGNPSPTLVTVVRKLPNNQQIPIRVDLSRAFRDRRERILIQPGDVIVMQEKPYEAIVRYLTQTVRVNTAFDAIVGGRFNSQIVGTNP